MRAPWKVAAVLLVLLLLAGCGGGQKGASGEAKEKASSQQEIPVGFASAFTGELGADGVPWYRAAQLAVEEINAAGGVLGRPLKLYCEDDQSSAEEGLKAARKLITVNKVVFIVGPSSDPMLADIPLAKQYKVPIFSPCAGTTRLDTLDGSYNFRTCPSDSADGVATAKFLYDKGIRKIALLMQNDEGRTSVGKAVADAFQKLGGTVLGQVLFNPDQTNYQAEVKKVRDLGAEVVWLGAGQETGSMILQEWQKQGGRARWIVSSDICIPQIFGLIPPQSLEGAWGEVPSAATDSPEFKRFAEAYKQKWGEDPGGAYCANTYDAYIVAALAMQAAGEASGEAIARKVRDVANPPGTVVRSFKEGLEALKRGEDINYEGAAGPVDFDKYGNVAGSHVIMEAKGGKWVELAHYGPHDMEQVMATLQK